MSRPQSAKSIRPESESSNHSRRLSLFATENDALPENGLGPSNQATKVRAVRDHMLGMSSIHLNLLSGGGVEYLFRMTSKKSPDSSAPWKPLPTPPVPSPPETSKQPGPLEPKIRNR